MLFRALVYRPRSLLRIDSTLSGFGDADVDFAFGSSATITRESLPGRTRCPATDHVR